MSLINSVKGKARTQTLDTIIDYKKAAEILGLAPKTVANGGAGTAKLQRRFPNGTVRYLESEVIQLRESWLEQSLALM
jgi:hypothetical protein